MLQFPRWKVDVIVGGEVVKTFHETATTSAAAIAKAKHKMRGAVSSAGAFKFKATEAGEPERHHATKKKLAEFDWEVSGPSDLARQGFMRGVKAKIKRIGVEAYDKGSGTYLGSSYFSATSKTDALKQAQASGWYFKALAENGYKPLRLEAGATL